MSRVFRKFFFKATFCPLVASHRTIAYCRSAILGLFINPESLATGRAFTPAIAVFMGFGMVAVNAVGHRLYWECPRDRGWLAGILI
jgi:hypothetical protein